MFSKLPISLGDIKIDLLGLPWPNLSPRDTGDASSSPGDSQPFGGLPATP